MEYIFHGKTQNLILNLLSATTLNLSTASVCETYISNHDRREKSGWNLWLCMLMAGFSSEGESDSQGQSFFFLALYLCNFTLFFIQTRMASFCEQIGNQMKCIEYFIAATFTSYHSHSVLAVQFHFPKHTWELRKSNQVEFNRSSF